MQNVKAMVFVFASFGLNSAFAGILTWPDVRVWGLFIFGKTRGWEQRAFGCGLTPNFEQLQYKGVSPAKTENAVLRWGGPTTLDWVEPGQGDDPYAHGITGDILSPGQTAKSVTRITEWIKGL